MEYKDILSNEKMTPEEKIAALQKLNLVSQESYDKLKKANDEASHEASEWKKKYNATLDENQRKEAEDKEANEQRDKELASLRREVAVTKSSKKFLGLGYSEEQASKAAKYLYEGDTEKLFEIQKAVMDAQVATAQAQVAANTPRPLSGTPTEQVITKETLRKMSASERMAFARDHADEYRQIYEGGSI